MEGALQEVHAILQRARDLAVQHNNDTYSFTDKMGIRTELFALSDEIARIEQSTQFNGFDLLQSNTTRVTFQIGANAGDVLAITLVDLFGGAAGNLVRPNTFFTVPFASDDIAGFDLHIDDVANARGWIGATINRLEHVLNSNSIYQENLMGAESRIRDVDMAMEITELTKQQVILASAQTASMFARLTPRRLSDILFGPSQPGPHVSSAGGGGSGGFGAGSASVSSG
jgi:flagellin